MRYSQQQLPNSPEVERAVLGACVLSKDALGTSVEILKPDDFYDVNNKLAFEILTGMYFSDVPIDLVTVISEFKSKGVFDRLGGQPFIAELINDITTTANVAFHAEIVRENSVRRKLIEAGNQIIALAYQNNKDIKEIIETIEKLIFDASQNKNSSDFQHIRDVLAPVVLDVEEKSKSKNIYNEGYRTDFRDLDMYTGGFKPGSLNIIAARPSMGKTAFALNIAQFGGDKKKNLPVLIFSLEMTSEQLVMRMLAAESGVDLTQLFKGTFSTNDFEKVKRAAETLSMRNIYINDESMLSAIDFRTKCRRFKTKHSDLSLVIVDYLQLMTGGTVRSEGRQQEVSDISRMLKAVAREINCPVIALSQLSRAVESRNEKKPQLSDLRDSGAIEQDADVVMLLYRGDYYTEDENNPNLHSEADIRVAKNRNGSTGTFKLTFQREITRFVSHEEERNFRQ